MVDRIYTSAALNHPRGRAVWVIVMLVVFQLMLGAVVHHHALSDHGAEGNGAIHGDFSHEWHADQHGMVPDGLVPDSPLELTAVPVLWALTLILFPALVLRVFRPREQHAGPSPPRYCLPQPRDPPPHFRLT